MPSQKCEVMISIYKNVMDLLLSNNSLSSKRLSVAVALLEDYNLKAKSA